MSDRSIFVELDASGDISIARKSFQMILERVTVRNSSREIHNDTRGLCYKNKKNRKHAIYLFSFMLLLKNDSTQVFNNLEGIF